MKNLIKLSLMLGIVTLSLSCNNTDDPKLKVQQDNTTQNGDSGKKIRHLINKYQVVRTFENNLSDEFEIAFNYDASGKLLSSNRIDKSYNTKTKMKVEETFTNHFLTHDENGIPSQVKILNSGSSKLNSYAIHELVSEKNYLQSVNLKVIKDDRVSFTIPNNLKLNYNQEKQLISYQSGNNKGHDFVYQNGIHTSSLLEKVSNYDFSYSTTLSPTADYNSINQYIINNIIESENARGFGILNKFMPSKITNRSGGFYEFITKNNSSGFPIEIIERNTQYDGRISPVKIVTKLEYLIINE